MTNAEASEALLSSISKPKPKKASGPSTNKVAKEIKSVNDLIQNPKRWNEISVDQLVYIYGLLHEKVYGVTAVGELCNKEFLGARSAAKKTLEKEFNGDVTAVLQFFRWVWNREKEREQWRRENRQEGSRITWRKMFSAGLVTEYRLALARKKPFTRANKNEKGTGRE